MPQVCPIICGGRTNKRILSKMQRVAKRLLENAWGIKLTKCRPACKRCGAVLDGYE